MLAVWIAIVSTPAVAGSRGDRDWGLTASTCRSPTPSCMTRAGTMNRHRQYVGWLHCIHGDLTAKWPGVGRRGSDYQINCYASEFDRRTANQEENKHAYRSHRKDKTEDF